MCIGTCIETSSHISHMIPSVIPSGQTWIPTLNLSPDPEMGFTQTVSMLFKMNLCLATELTKQLLRYYFDFF